MTISLDDQIWTRDGWKS